MVPDTRWGGTFTAPSKYNLQASDGGHVPVMGLGATPLLSLLSYNPSHLFLSIIFTPPYSLPALVCFPQCSPLCILPLSACCRSLLHLQVYLLDTSSYFCVT
jgi:hypothetical protein